MVDAIPHQRGPGASPGAAPADSRQSEADRTGAVYAVVWGLRRWMVSLWTGVAVLSASCDVWIAAPLMLPALAADLWWVPRSYDFRVSHRTLFAFSDRKVEVTLSDLWVPSGRGWLGLGLITGALAVLFAAGLMTATDDSGAFFFYATRALPLFLIMMASRYSVDLFLRAMPRNNPFVSRVDTAPGPSSPSAGSARRP